MKSSGKPIQRSSQECSPSNKSPLPMVFQRETDRYPPQKDHDSVFHQEYYNSNSTLNQRKRRTNILVPFNGILREVNGLQIGRHFLDKKRENILKAFASCHLSLSRGNLLGRESVVRHCRIAAGARTKGIRWEQSRRKSDYLPQKIRARSGRILSVSRILDAHLQKRLKQCHSDNATRLRRERLSRETVCCSSQVVLCASLPRERQGHGGHFHGNSRLVYGKSAAALQ
jgi:hypothetical protein